MVSNLVRHQERLNMDSSAGVGEAEFKTNLQKKNLDRLLNGEQIKSSE